MILASVACTAPSPVRSLSTATKKCHAVPQSILTCRGILKSLSDVSLLTLLLGKRQQEAEWVTTTTEGSKFHQRYGLLFEEYRGPEIGRRDATLDVDLATGRVDRGKLLVLRERPLQTVPVPKFDNNCLRLGSNRVYRYHLQLLSNTADLIVCTCALFPIVKPDTDKDTDQVIGMVMLLSEALVLLVQTMEYATLCIGPALEKYNE